MPSAVGSNGKLTRFAVELQNRRQAKGMSDADNRLADQIGGEDTRYVTSFGVLFPKRSP